MAHYRNTLVHIRPEAIPEYWLERQKALQEAAALGEVEGIEAVAAGGRISREEAERLLGGGSTLTAVAADDDVLPDDEGGSEE